MLVIWSWPDVETILSDIHEKEIWVPDALIQRPQDLPTFIRQQWDERRLEDFGPWRFSPDADPLKGQTEPLVLEAQTEDPAPDQDENLIESPESLGQGLSSDLTLKQEQVDEMIRVAKESAWAEGHQAAEAALLSELEAERQTLRAVAEKLNSLQSDPQQWLAPMKKLAIHVAQELVRGELRLGTTVIERLIHACLDALDQPAQSALVQVGHEDLQRLGELSLPGVILELDADLSAGSVRVKVQDTQVQDLMEHRLKQIARDILGEDGDGQLR